MPRAKIALEGMTIVFRGAFNPAIFHPTWYQRHQLLPEDEAEKADVVVVSRDVAIFSTERFTFQVTDDRFAVATERTEAFDPLRDLAVGTFQLLSHTPLRLLGINRIVHFQVGSEDVWHEVGHRLAPKDVWLPVLERPGLRSLGVAGVRPDGRRGAVNVRVEPSGRIHPGVFVEVNDHFELEAGEQGARSVETRGSQLVSVLDQEWQNSLDRSQRIIDHLGEFIWTLCKH
jgi:hypothetical protein